MGAIKPDELVEEFARRTRKNLATLRQLQNENPQAEIYEVTQLVNSMLGLLVFPQQKFMDAIPEIPLDELAKKGWPIPKIVGKYNQARNLKELVRYLRNAIAHLNLEFTNDRHDQISGLRVWNCEDAKGGGKRKTWEAELSIADIEQLSDKFIALLLKEE